jgi:hypothetical protein
LFSTGLFSNPTGVGLDSLNNLDLPQFYNKLDSFNITDKAYWGIDETYITGSDKSLFTANRDLAKSISAHNYP